MNQLLRKLVYPLNVQCTVKMEEKVGQSHRGIGEKLKVSSDSVFQILIPHFLDRSGKVRNEVETKNMC